MKHNCMLAHEYDLKRVKFPAYVQPKLNGVRAILEKTRYAGWILTSRQGNILYVPHITDVLDNTFNDSCVYDGELYIHTMPFDYISGKARRGINNADNFDLEYHVYDIIDCDKTFGLRFIRNDTELDKTHLDSIKWVNTYCVNSEEDIYRYHEKFLSEGYEGTMIRNNLKYELKRSFNLLKLKSWKYAVCTVIGMNEGTGKYEGMLGSLIVKDKDGRVFSLSGKLSDMDRAVMFKSDIAGHQVVIKYRDLNENGIPVPATFEKMVEGSVTL